MKTILVTGGNRGIGLEICRQLDALGHTVIMGSRDIENGERAALSLSKNVIAKQLDVTDEESIQTLFEYVKTHFGKLDVLINNSGISEKNKDAENSFFEHVKTVLQKNFHGVWRFIRLSVPFLRKAGVIAKNTGANDVSLLKVRYIMETNFYGAWRMIQVFIPLLLKSEGGRIINVSSGMGQLKSLTGYAPGYSLSKASLNALTIMLSNELTGKGIKVNAVCPGWVKTDMGGPDAPRSVDQGADTAVWLATEKEIPSGKFFQDREEIPW